MENSPAKKFTLKHQLLLFALVVVLAAAAAWLFVFQAQWHRLGELNALYGNERRQVAAIEAHVAAHPDAAKHMAELDAKRQVVDQLLPVAPGVSDFLIVAEKAARASGSQLLQVKPSQTAAKNALQETMLEVIVRGDFFQTVGFLKQLEDAPRFNAVTGLTMNVKPGGGLETKLQVVIYNTK
jgi:Tfp pilus assembly protein PilO